MESLDQELAARMAENKRRRLEAVNPAALRIASYFVDSKPHLLIELCLADKLHRDDVEAVMLFNGISTEAFNDSI